LLCWLTVDRQIHCAREDFLVQDGGQHKLVGLVASLAAPAHLNHKRPERETSSQRAFLQQEGKTGDLNAGHDS
jgi:hypothetical protein